MLFEFYGGYAMKNAIKKAIAVLLVAVMVIGAAPLAGLVGLELPELYIFTTKAKAEETAISGTCGDNLTWTLNKSTGELVISGTGFMYGFSYLNAPWDCLSIKTVTGTDFISGLFSALTSSYSTPSSSSQSMSV